MTGVGVKPSSRLNDRLDAVGGEHFEGGSLGRAGQGVRVLADEERPVDAFAVAVLADRLRDGEDVRLGERAVERRAAVAAGAEADELLRIVEVRLALVVIALQLGHIDQHGGGRRPACGEMNCHALFVAEEGGRMQC